MTAIEAKVTNWQQRLDILLATGKINEETYLKFIDHISKAEESLQNVERLQHEQ